MHADRHYLQAYLSVAPIPLGLVRAIECRHMAAIGLEGRILDAGCGDGLFASILGGGRPGWVHTGIDRDPAELVRARRSGAYRELLAADMTCLPFAEATFDTVISNSVLEHIPDVDKAMAELARVLKPGGRLVFCVPSEQLAAQFFFAAFFRRCGLPRLAEGYGRLKNRVWRHYHLDTPARWEARCTACGLEVLTLRYIHPEPVTALCDLFTWSGALSLLWRACCGRLLLFPSRLRGRLMAWLLGGYYLAEAPVGSTVFVVARKRTKAGSA